VALSRVAERRQAGERRRIRQNPLLSLCLLCVLALASCSGTRPSDVGIAGLGLAPCPSSPNCVSSDASDAAHHADAFELSAPADEVWGIVQEEIARLPRATVVESTPSYLHVECASALFGFVDDLELQLRVPDGLVAVRSASRVGYSDLGVNRRRVEQLRGILRARGVVR
jgi:uncharacterized protein (DUF1499 family)